MSNTKFVLNELYFEKALSQRQNFYACFEWVKPMPEPSPKTPNAAVAVVVVPEVVCFAASRLQWRGECEPFLYQLLMSDVTNLNETLYSHRCEPDPRQPDNNIILNIASKFAKNKMELMFSIWDLLWLKKRQDKTGRQQQYTQDRRCGVVNIWWAGGAIMMAWWHHDGMSQLSAMSSDTPWTLGSGWHSGSQGIPALASETSHSNLFTTPGMLRSSFLFSFCIYLEDPSYCDTCCVRRAIWKWIVQRIGQNQQKIYKVI